MENNQAQRSISIDSKTKQKLIEQAKVVQNTASLYLDMYNIDLNGNGKIVESKIKEKNNFKKIQLSESDSVKAANNTPCKVGVLVSCSHRRAGGGWLSGSIAQEEAISRVSTWAIQAELKQFDSWYQQNSWIGQKGALVIDGLLLFNENLEELNHPKSIVFAGIAAANKAALKNDNYWHSEKGIIERQTYLIDNLVMALQELEKRGVETVILCAFGTNVFGWSLEESIQVLHEATKYVSDKLLFQCWIVF